MVDDHRGQNAVIDAANTNTNTNTNRGQDRLVRFLSGHDWHWQVPAEYRSINGIAHGERETFHTHCAHVFLSGSLALKIKRAVRLPYLDMSSLDRRRRLLQRELELNRTALPNLYLAVLPIRWDGRTLRLEGEGKIVEWGLLMRRFDPDLVLDRLADRHRLDATLADALGRSISRYHATCARKPVSDGARRIDEVLAELESEYERLNGILPHDLTRPLLETVRRCLHRFAPMLDKRGKDGWIRRCHGDLHLRNVLLHEGKPVPFDALEFDERMATTDILYDLAFALMDLACRDLHIEANRCMNAYLLDPVEDRLTGLSLLPMFMACRAMIRAMTSAETALLQRDESNRQSASARRYLEFATTTMKPQGATLVAIGGFSGTGKSTLARALAPFVGPTPGALLFDSDVERKRAAGLPPTARLPNSLYDVEHANAHYERMLEHVSRVLATNRSVVVDATFLNPRWRHTVEDVARRHGACFFGFWLEAPSPVLVARLNARVDDASDADATVLGHQRRRGAGGIDWIHVDAATPSTLLARQAMAAIGEAHLGVASSSRQS